MARFRLTFVLMAFAILSSGIAVPEDQDTQKGGAISGHIKDTTLLESPINGVRVVFVNADGAEFETQTDANGDYEHAGLPAGRYLANLYEQAYEDRVGKPVTVIDESSFFEKYGRTILDTLFSTIMAGISGWFVLAFARYLNRHQRSLNERRRNLIKRQRQQYLNER